MPPETGFSFVNLAIVAAVALVVVPAYRRLRDSMSRRRRERWAAEDAAYEALVAGQDGIDSPGPGRGEPAGA